MADRGIGVGGLANSLEDYSTSRYNLFAPFTFNQEVVSFRTDTYVPTTVRENYDKTIPIQFVIPPETQDWTKLKTFKLHGRVRVRNTTTGDDPKADECFSLVNGWPHALFSDISVKISGCDINDPTRMPYPYKAILECLLVHDKTYQKTVMSADGFIKDNDAVKDNTITAYNQAPDSGFTKRSIGLRGGGYIEFCVPIHSDVITASRDLPPGHRIEVVMNRNADKFVMWNARENANEYEIILTDLRLTLEKVKLVDTIFNAYYNKVGSPNCDRKAEIPFTRNLIKSYTTRANQRDWSYSHFITNNRQLPETVYVVFVPLAAYDGHKHENPFNFKQVKFQEASLIINACHEPPIPLTNVMESYRMRDMYDHFLNNTGRDHFNSSSVNISMEEYYEKGYFILAWDRTPSGNNRFTRSTMDYGSISLNLKLATQPPEDEKYQVIVYCSYSDSIKIDGTHVSVSTSF